MLISPAGISVSLMKGVYLLIICVKNDSVITIGKLGSILFPKNTYVYVGSAMNGLQQRIKRHVRVQKKRHWHIDYLLEHANITEVYYKESMMRIECDIAQFFQQRFRSVLGFGCSDCSCASHLFFGSNKEILSMIKELHMQKANP